MERKKGIPFIKYMFIYGHVFFGQSDIEYSKIMKISEFGQIIVRIRIMNNIPTKVHSEHGVPSIYQMIM